MRKFISALFLLALSHTCLYSQNDSQFGSVTHQHFARTYNLKDKDAPAVVVFESGNYSFVREDNSVYIYDRFYSNVYTRIHILKQAGIEHANFEIPYYSSSEDVDKITIEGYTYNLDSDGNVIRTSLSESNIFDEKISDNVRVKKIAMPDVREGSIVELRYRHGTIAFDMPVWMFQKDIPVLYSQLRYEEAPRRRYALIFKGADRYDHYAQDEYIPDGVAYSSAQTLNIYTFGMKDLPAFKKVDFLRNAIDYRVGIYPQLASVALYSGGVKNYLSSWPIMRKNLLSDANFGKYIKSSAKEAKEVVPTLDLDDHDEAGKIEAIVRYVKNNYTWNGGNGKFAHKKLSAFLKEKTGNAGNMNLFLAGLLQAAGVEAHPVILRTKPDGTINRSYPFVDFFNFVVVQATAGGKTYYLDATDTFCPFDMVSLNCISTEGLVLKPKTEEWVMITNPHRSVSHASMKFAIDPASGVITGDAVESFSGLDAVKKRRQYYGEQERLEEMVEGEGFITHDLRAENYSTDLSKPFLIKYEFETEMDSPGADKIFLSPLLHFTPTDNMFKETERQYPIDLVAQSVKSYNVSIAIPEDYAVEHLPAFKKVDTREISMTYSAFVEEGVINVNAQFIFKNAVYPYSDYNLLKKYYTDMMAAFSENIILSRGE